MIDKKDNLRTQALDLLRFPLAVIVLSIHIFSTKLIFQNQDIDYNSFPIFNEFVNFINAFLRSQSVPIYYFISGVVFFIGLKQWNNEKYKNKVKNRIKSLLIPYIIWNVLFIILTISTYIGTSKFGGTDLMAQEYTLNVNLKNILSCFWFYDGSLVGAHETFQIASNYPPINYPLWFVRDLMIMVVFAPLIYWFVKRLKINAIILLGVIWALNQYGIRMPFYFPCAAAFFFSWGAYMTINDKDMIAEFGKYAKISLVLYIALGLLYITAVHIYPDALKVIKGLNIIVGLVFAYNLAVYLIKNDICRSNKFLSASSFFIYVSHALIYGKVLRLIFVLVSPTNDFSLIMVYLAAVIVNVLLLLLSFWLMKRYTPSLLKIVAGRK